MNGVAPKLKHNCEFLSVALGYKNTEPSPLKNSGMAKATPSETPFLLRECSEASDA